MKGVSKIMVVAMALLMVSTMAFAKGNLVVYSPNSDGEVQGILYYFGDKYDIKISLQSMGREKSYQLTAEKAIPSRRHVRRHEHGRLPDEQRLFQPYWPRETTFSPKLSEYTGYFTITCSRAATFWSTRSGKKLGIP